VHSAAHSAGKGAVGAGGEGAHARGRREEVGSRWEALSVKLSPSLRCLSPGPIPTRRGASLLLRRAQRGGDGKVHPRAGIAGAFGAQGPGELRKMFRAVLRELDPAEQQELRDVLHREALARGMHSYSVALRHRAPVSARATGM